MVASHFCCSCPIGGFFGCSNPLLNKLFPCTRLSHSFRFVCYLLCTGFLAFSANNWWLFSFLFFLMIGVLCLFIRVIGSFTLDCTLWCRDAFEVHQLALLASLDPFFSYFWTSIGRITSQRSTTRLTVWYFTLVGYFDESLVVLFVLDYEQPLAFSYLFGLFVG